MSQHDYIAYLRVSTHEQAQHGLSLKAQGDQILRFIDYQGWNLADLFVDEGQSAKTLASKGVPTIYDKGVGNVLAFPREEPVDHPSPKPLGLMQRLIRAVTLPGDLILDPFMGGGTTLRAAKNEGRRCIGIESVEQHCEAAASRLAQEVLDFGEAA